MLAIRDSTMTRRRRSFAGLVVDFTLSNNSVATQWGIVTVGTLNPVNAPAGVITFRLKESAGASGDDAGFGVRNG